MKTMLNKFFVLAILVPGALAVTSCKRVVKAGPEKLESFAVSFDFDAATLTAAGCGSSNPDTCLPGPGTKDQPLDYVHDHYVDVFLNIEAIGSNGTRPFPWDGELGLRLARGRLHSQLDPVKLVAGKTTAARVRLQHVPGGTVIFVEDKLDGVNAEAPTYAVGASQRLYFAQPTIAQAQESRNEGEAALNRESVEITSGDMYVTRVAANGFNVQDVNDDRWNGMYVYTYGSTEGLVEGSHMLLVGGTVTEFLGSTQIAFPIYGGPYTRCEVNLGADNAGAEDTEVDVGMTLNQGSCPPMTNCMPVQEQRGDSTVSVHRCVPDQDPERYDSVFGRVKCNGASDTTSCPRGMSCQLSVDPDESSYFCLVDPVPAPMLAWPKTTNGAFPYCGPYHTDRENPLNTESYEDKLVTLTSSDGALRVEGLPLCKKVDDLSSVRSTCHLSDDVPDCPLARAGDEILRDAQGQACWRGFQACKDEGIPWQQLRSTCNGDATLDYCTPAEAGDPVLRNDAGKICRGTMDDLLMGGWTEYNQWKVTYMDDTGTMRCASLVADALPNFDALSLQESPGQLSRVTGTLKQSYFSTGSSYWVIELRKPADLQF